MREKDNLQLPINTSFWGVGGGAVMEKCQEGDTNLAVGERFEILEILTGIVYKIK